MKPQKKRKRFGIVKFQSEYVVDLDDNYMIDHAKQAVEEDVYNAVKFEEVHKWIKIVNDPKASEKDIPSFLIDNEN